MPAVFPDWKKLLRTARPVTGTATLDRRFIYILPTRQGWLFALLMLCMLTGAINYTLSLGFLLTFLLAGLGMVAMLHTWRNLVRLELASGKLTPAFAGDPVRWELRINDPDGCARYAIGLGLDRNGNGIEYTDIDASGRQLVVLSLETSKRGPLTPGRLTVCTEFPLGLFHAWSYVELDARCLVYPCPAPLARPLPPAATQSATGNAQGCAGDEDFSGLRAHQNGDSPKRIDWKASARKQQLLTKEFQGVAENRLWLDWKNTSGDTEQRLSQLTRQLLDASEAGLAYGLRLPQQEIPIDSGAAHDRRCLEALALFGLPI
ncbi:hypothetical protein GALL_324820 [mine drainage metagenome]|uniref:DUF58 domain-containing protein n=1 Tax=mine drainage metagenome TaxID=410659 RepID=A0A1J5R140_9ZZZZ